MGESEQRLEWEPGDVIASRWEIHDVKRGGMGVVYVCFDRLLRQAVALKMIQSEVTHNDARDRFTREAYVWQQMGVHENVVELIGIEEIGGGIALNLEYVSTGDLATWLASRRDFTDLSTPLAFALDICNALIHAHSKGLRAHRDLKPANCLLTEDGSVKVTDFGIAKLDFEGWLEGADEDSPTDPAMTRGAMGTWAYMAPEQFESASNVDIRGDIYSFGVLFMELLTGQRPFKATDPMGLYRLHKNGRVPSLQDYMSASREVEALDIVIKKCLRKDPSDRFPDFFTLRHRLGEDYRTITGEDPSPPARGELLDVRRMANRVGNLNVIRRHDEALQLSDQALRLTHSNTTLWNNRGVAFLGLGKLSEAEECFRTALGLPNTSTAGSSGAWSNLAVVLRQSGRVDEAKGCYEKSLAIDPLNQKTLANITVLLMAEGHWADALAYAEKALKIDDRLPEAIFSKAQTLIRLGRSEEALEWCIQHQEILLSTTTTEYEFVSSDDAEQSPDYERLIAEGRGGWAAYLNLVVATSERLYESGDFDEASRVLREALVRLPDSVMALVNLAYVELARSSSGECDWEEMLSLLDRALERDDMNWRALTAKAAAMCYGYGNHREARIYYELAVEAGDPTAADRLRECDLQHSRPDRSGQSRVDERISRLISARRRSQLSEEGKHEREEK